MTAYLQTFEWGVDFVEEHLGKPMDSMRSRLYAHRGIEPGDLMYLAYIDATRRLNLISRLEVAKMMPRADDEGDVIDAKLRSSTAMALERPIPNATAKRLRFLVREGFDERGEPIYAEEKTQLTYDEDGRLKNQTARTIRRLDETSARLLDAILDQTK
jgi:hypothetical protein